MQLNRVKIKNFKSFKDVDVKFNKLNVLVGANASGKSNFRNFFGFLKNIVDDKKPGLEKAIINQCGTKRVNYFLNTNLGTEQPFETEIAYSNPYREFLRGNNPITIFPREETYSFKLAFTGKDNEYTILEDLFRCDCKLDKTDEQEFDKFIKHEGKITSNFGNLTSRQIVLKNENGNYSFTIIYTK